MGARSGVPTAPAFATTLPLCRGRCTPALPRPARRPLQPRRAAVRASATPPTRVVVGLTQYSHDASVAVVDACSGAVLFALSKERLTRRKHDGGGTAALLRHALRELCVPLDAVALVVANNHHHRIADFEARAAFGVAAGFLPREYVARWNLTPGVEKVELSHHLAHAWSAVRGARVGDGSGGGAALVVVMDGMGDSRAAWARREAEPGRLICDNDLEVAACGFVEWPPRRVLDDVASGVSYREAESVYLAVRGTGGRVELRRVFKRWTPEVSPPELYNHGFHDMESVGAVYSRVATAIFGDWNACGKVMGLAPCARGRREAAAPLVGGRLYDGSFSVRAEAMAQLPREVDGEEDGLDRPLAAGVQADLEDTTLAFLEDLRKAVGADVRQLVFAGGVALNSTLNGRIVRESGFDSVFVPPCPGDEGVAIGCAIYGYEHMEGMTGEELVTKDTRGDIATLPYRPYLGTAYNASQITMAVERFASWTVSQTLPRFEDLALEVVELLKAGEVVAWFNGAAEFGPRALGNRSLLADPRRPGMVDKLNLVVKRRESFRPFAPSCLAPHLDSLFGSDCSSPYMTITMPLLDPIRTPAVAHVDGTARLQTLARDENPDYYGLIDAFFAATGVPAVLNTSFNVAGEPIVHSPTDALRALLSADGIAAVAFPGAKVLVRARECPLEKEGRVDDARIELACGDFRSEVVRSATGNELRISVMFDEYSDDCDGDNFFSEEYDDDTMEEFLLSRRVELNSVEDLDVLEFIAGLEEPTTLSELCEEVDQEADSTFESADKIDDDPRESMREILTSLWSRRLITLSQ